MPELPPSRPASEPTFYSYMIANDQILRVFRCVVEQLNMLSPLPYDQVLALNGRLADAFSAIPLHLQRQESDHSNHPIELVAQRIQLDMFYHKVMCVLHRRYMSDGLKLREFHLSTVACIRSSLALLECQRLLNGKECRGHHKWYMFSVSNHDFILAATMLCLYLTRDNRSRSSEENMGENESVHMDINHSEIQKALEASHAIWSEVRDTSKEAHKAFSILDYMVGNRLPQYKFV
ncbi:hypothetical protein MMC28_008815 [Mycoblastus sanguinarius]|nr:hypothetical protein [Mycoblastus sanguinarius]